MTSHFVAFLAKVDHYLSAWQVLKKDLCVGTFWARTSLKLGTHQGTSRKDLLQGLASGTSPLVCTRILHRNSSRKDHIFGHTN